MRLLFRLPLTFGARQHRTSHSEHIPIQNDFLKLPRGSGQAHPGSPGSQKKQKVRETRYCYLMQETSSEWRRGSFNPFINPTGLRHRIEYGFLLTFYSRISQISICIHLSLLPAFPIGLWWQHMASLIYFFDLVLAWELAHSTYTVFQNTWYTQIRFITRIFRRWLFNGWKMTFFTMVMRFMAEFL